MEPDTTKRTARTSKNRSDEGSSESGRAIRRGTGRHGREDGEETGTGEVGGRRESTPEDSHDPVESAPPQTTTARDVLNQIGKEFNELSEKHPVEAWKVYRKRLMENFGILCEVMTPKDITELSMKIEENIHGKTGSAGGSPLDQVREFLGEQVH